LLQQGAIKTIVCEVTFDLVSDWHTRFDEVRELLTPHGYILFGIYECVRWGAHLRYCNVMFVREADFPPLSA